MRTSIIVLMQRSVSQPHRWRSNRRKEILRANWHPILRKLHPPRLKALRTRATSKALTSTAAASLAPGSIATTLSHDRAAPRRRPLNPNNQLLSG